MAKWFVINLVIDYDAMGKHLQRRSNLRPNGDLECICFAKRWELPMQTIYSSTGWDSYAWAFRVPAKMVDVIVHRV